MTSEGPIASQTENPGPTGVETVDEMSEKNAVADLSAVTERRLSIIAPSVGHNDLDVIAIDARPTAEGGS
jgi:hypothetical protein